MCKHWCTEKLFVKCANIGVQKNFLSNVQTLVHRKYFVKCANISEQTNWLPTIDRDKMHYTVDSRRTMYGYNRKGRKQNKPTPTHI